MSFLRPIDPATGSPKRDDQLTVEEMHSIRTQIQHDMGNSTRSRAAVPHDTTPLDRIEGVIASKEG